ncbi:MAG: tail fiber protein [Rhizomicrobium sp.]
MSMQYIGQVMLYGFNFAPINFAFCQGQQIAISQNEALFSIIGTTYGGNGVTTFSLPNLMDRSVMSWGQGPSLSNYDLGQTSGQTSVTLSQSQLPQHNHLVYGTQPGATTDYGLVPTQNGWFGDRGQPGRIFAPTPTGNTLGVNALQPSGGSQPHENEQPILGMNYCIALYGIFPSRN